MREPVRPAPPAGRLARLEPGLLAIGAALLALALWPRGAAAERDAGLARGVDAYRRGAFPEALAALQAAAQHEAPGTPAELWLDLALAALSNGDTRAAETAAQRLAARGSREQGLADFLLGNAAFVEGELAEAEAEMLQADPTALRLAAQHVERAREAWLRALMSAEGWPSARRNLARAEAKLEVLALKQEDAEARRKTKKAKQKKREKGPTETEERATEAQRARAASPEEIAAILDKLAENEEAKRRVRRLARASKQKGVARDW